MPAPVRPPPGAAVKKPAQPPAAPPPEADAPASRLGWFLGWVVVPGTVFAAIFTGGAVVGAHFPESVVTRAIVWCAGLFGG